MIPARRECEAVTSEVCKIHGFDSAVFPNILNVTNQLEAKQRVDTLIQSFQEDRLVRLSHDFVCKLFDKSNACRMVYRRCNSTNKGYSILPCQDFCQGELSILILELCPVFLDSREYARVHIIEWPNVQVSNTCTNLYH